jgi:hypothetical protein
MHNSQSYRDNAAKCLLAAQESREPHYRRLHLSMALSWLSLAREDEAVDGLLTSWYAAKPVKGGALVGLKFLGAATWPKSAPAAQDGGPVNDLQRA